MIMPDRAQVTCTTNERIGKIILIGLMNVTHTQVLQCNWLF